MNAHTKYLAIFIFLLLSKLTYADELISLIKITGKVQISNDMKNWTTIKKPQKIENKTWLKTGKSASVILVLPDRTQTKVTRNSKLFLEKKPKKKQTINLKLGKIWSKTNKIPVKISLKSPNAVASIRGTEWVSEVKADGSSTIALLEGKISLVSKNNEKVNIDSGSVASINKQGSVSQTKIINTGKYLQFLYNYEIEPYAYLTEEQLNKFINQSNSGDLSQNNLGRGEFFVSNQELSPEILKIIEYVNTNKISELINYIQNKPITENWKSWQRFIKAETLILNGNVEDFKKYSKRLPDDNRKIYIWAKFNISQGKLKKAKELLLSISPEKRMSFHNHQLGKIYKVMGKNKQAFKHFEIAHTQAKFWINPLIEMASLAMLDSNFDYANTLLTKAKKLPNKSLEYKSIAMQFFTLRNQVEKSEQILTTIQEDKLNFSTITDAGVIELKKGNASEAIKKIVDATAIERNYSRAYSFLAVAHFHKGETKEALRQLERSIEFDPLDPMPHIIASAIHSSELRFDESIAEANQAKKKSKNTKNLRILETDQQGTINVGSRFHDIGLPKLAKSAGKKIRDVMWSGSYFYDAKISDSKYVKNSKYLMGYMLDSQVFGARRDKPDIISRPGDYGYTEFKADGVNETKNYSIKRGFNGRTISGDIESSYLVDFGVFGAERDAYFASDDTDISYAGLGFFGLGLRKNYDNNLFLTGNIVPFHTGGTYPVDDLTSRFDIGVSKRTDKATNMLRLGVEKANSTVEILVSGGCDAKDKQNTHKIELGVSEIGKLPKGGNYLISFENGIKRGDMDFTVTHPTSGNCTDLPNQGNYSNRQDNVQSVESDHIITGIINKKLRGIEGTLKVRYGNYQHDFDQKLILDGTPEPEFLSNANYYRLRPSIGIETEILGGNISLANISDMKMVSSTSFTATDIASIYPKFEFMNSGGKIEQNSIKYNNNFFKNLTLNLEFDQFEIFNNPIKQVIREQWNSELLENFTLKNYDNPNLKEVVEGHDDFVAAKFDMFEISVERDFFDGFSMILGFGNIDANELDHPYYIESSSLGRVKLIPETYYYAGITFPYFDGIVSGKISKQENLISTTRTTDYNTSNYTLNFTRKFLEKSNLISLNLEGGIEGTSDHKVGLTYRKTY